MEYKRVRGYAEYWGGEAERRARGAGAKAILMLIGDEWTGIDRMCQGDAVNRQGNGGNCKKSNPLASASCGFSMPLGTSVGSVEEEEEEVIRIDAPLI